MFRQIVASLALATLASASTPPNKARDGPGPNPIHARLAGHREGPVAESWHKWRKRQTAAGLQNQQTGTAYTIDLEIGTPPQNITVMVDTGSVNLWVNPDCANYDQESYCDGFAQFDYTQSSTIEDTGIEDDLAYGKGEVVVQYVTDVVSIGCKCPGPWVRCLHIVKLLTLTKSIAASITAQQFGIALESTDIGFGLLGLSPPLDGNEEYSYVLDSMVDQGLIESRAFSLDLRDIDSPDGALIFGGVDTGKFIGSLTKCPILDASETPSGMDRYWINMNYIGMTDSDGNSGLLASGELAVFLDSGGTLTRLPTSVFNLIGDAFAPLGAEYDDDQGVYIVDCDLAKESGSIDFGFGDQVIGVSFKNFIWPLSDKNTCILGIQADDGEPFPSTTTRQRCGNKPLPPAQLDHHVKVPC